MNYFDNYDWKTMLERNPPRDFDLADYRNILCPKSDYPDFLDKYIKLPVLQRLGGIGLLCGTDWTALYKNRMPYSRLDHSLGVALIVWHFTHNKAQTIAGLLHDISTTTFSHVSDFRKGDALTQTATEGPTATIIRNDAELQSLLKSDGLTSQMVEDYHIYPVADNEIPQLSADRLEYMYPSGMGLDGSWTMDEIARTYNDISVLTNEQGLPELGFNTVEIAEEYCEHFCMIGHILQLNENKLTLQLLGKVMSQAVEQQSLKEDDFMTLSEAEVIEVLDKKFSSNKFYTTFRTMKEILHTAEPMPADEYYNVSLKVKQRYINPLVNTEASVALSPKGDKATDASVLTRQNSPLAQRLYDVSPKAKKIIDDFLTYTDTAYGCVKLV